MKKHIKAAICVPVSLLTFSMVGSSVAMAAPAAANQKCGGDKVAVANVTSELMIRKSASENSEVIGYIPSAAGVIVEYLDEGWSKVTSGGVTGYVKTDYLAWGDKAEELKSVYGVLGAVAAWDDVKVFADHEDTSSVIGTLNEGEGYEVLGSTENWVEIQLGSGDKAYVAAEDVEMTLVLDTAVASDGYVPPAAVNTQNSAQTEYVAEAEYVPEAEYIPDVEYTEYVPETEYVETGYVPETEYIETEYVPETEYIETEYIPETEYVEAEYTEEYVETDEEDSYDDGLMGDEYIDPETESTGAEASGDDVDLLAALIYCEAGNQSMEGKIAVGQVVMNRVASGSFANTIRDVIYESGQFTPASSGWLDSVIGSAPSDCYDAALAALNGEGSVPGCLYFNAGSGKGVQIGDHQFY